MVERTTGEGEEDELAKRQAEAYVVAERVRRLVDEQGWRQGDIVVLLPQLTEVDQYQDALVAQRPAAYTWCAARATTLRTRWPTSRRCFVCFSILMTIWRFSRCCGRLWWGCPMIALYLLGRASRARRTRSLWEAVRDGSAFDVLDNEDQERLQTLLARLDGLRERIGRPGLSRLIDDALTACDYDLCLLAAPAR